VLNDVMSALDNGTEIELHNHTRDERYRMRHNLSRRQLDMIRSGSLINLVREEA
jgi:aconitate hydratase